MRRYLIHIDLSAGRWPFPEMHCDLSAQGSAGRHGMAVCVCVCEALFQSISQI